MLRGQPGHGQWHCTLTVVVTEQAVVEGESMQYYIVRKAWVGKKRHWEKTSRIIFSYQALIALQCFSLEVQVLSDD